MTVIMKKHLLIGLLSLCVLSACSTYKTSSKEIRFSGTQFHEKPVIPVGNMEVENEQIRFLGWIEAYVTSPSFLKPAPTEQQANYVLAHEAKKQGADALLHVDYKKSITATGQSRISARGQAIEIRTKALPEQPEPSQLEQEQSFTAVLAVEADVPTQFDAGVAEETGKLAAEPLQTEQFASGQLVTSSAQQENRSQIQVATVAEPDTGIAEAVEASSSQLIVNTSAQSKKSNVSGASSALILKTEPVAPENTSGVQLIQHLNFFYDDELNRIQLMMNNASFLLEKAKRSKDREAMLAAERLLEQLRLQQQAFSIFKPAP